MTTVSKKVAAFKMQQLFYYDCSSTRLLTSRVNSSNKTLGLHFSYSVTYSFHTDSKSLLITTLGRYLSFVCSIDFKALP